MKLKLFMSNVAVCVFFILNINAQDTLKCTSGKLSTELNLSLTQGEISFNNLLNQVKFRIFASDKIAIRCAFTYKKIKQESESELSYGTYPIHNTSELKSSLIGLNVGIERHFKGTRRLSPYIGGDIGLAYKKVSENSENIEYSTEIEGAWQTAEIIWNGNNYYTSYKYTENGFFSFGINAVTGFDLYLAKNFFIGYEFILGINYIKYQTIKITYTATDLADPYYTLSPQPTIDSKEWNIGPNLINGIRVGYVF